MTTREEIDAAAERHRMKTTAYRQYEPIEAAINRLNDVHILADAYIAERADRQKRIETAAEQIVSWMSTLGAVSSNAGKIVMVRSVISHHLDGETT